MRGKHAVGVGIAAIRPEPPSEPNLIVSGAGEFTGRKNGRDVQRLGSQVVPGGQDLVIGPPFDDEIEEIISAFDIVVHGTGQPDGHRLRGIGDGLPPFDFLEPLVPITADRVGRVAGGNGFVTAVHRVVAGPLVRDLIGHVGGDVPVAH